MLVVVFAPADLAAGAAKAEVQGVVFVVPTMLSIAGPERSLGVAGWAAGPPAARIEMASSIADSPPKCLSFS